MNQKPTRQRPFAFSDIAYSGKSSLQTPFTSSTPPLLEHLGREGASAVAEEGSARGSTGVPSAIITVFMIKSRVDRPLDICSFCDLPSQQEGSTYIRVHSQATEMIDFARRRNRKHTRELDAGPREREPVMRRRTRYVREGTSSRAVSHGSLYVYLPRRVSST